MVIAVEIDTSIIPPACIMEKLHAERQAEKDAEAKMKRRAEEEARKIKEEQRKKEVIESIKKSNILSEINISLIEHGVLYITVGSYLYNEVQYGNKYYNWFLHRGLCAETPVDNVKNTELVFALFDLYEAAGYSVNLYHYSDAYYKDYQLTIEAKPNCNTCEI